MIRVSLEYDYFDRARKSRAFVGANQMYKQLSNVLCFEYPIRYLLRFARQLVCTIAHCDVQCNGSLHRRNLYALVEYGLWLIGYPLIEGQLRFLLRTSTSIMPIFFYAFLLLKCIVGSSTVA